MRSFKASNQQPAKAKIPNFNKSITMGPYKSKSKSKHKQQTQHKNHKQYFKQLKHAIKVTKTFEVQKSIRKLKELNDDESKKKEVLENKIRCLKQLDINSIAQECLNSIIDNSKSESIGKDEKETELINAIKRHPRCIKTINEIKKSIISSTNQEFLKKHRKQSKNTFTNPSLLFVESLSGRPNDEDKGNDDPDVDNFDNESFDPAISFNKPIKTNRPGQRSRKAKKLALENKEQGTTWDTSINFREKKKRKDDFREGKKRKDDKSKETRSVKKIKASASDVAQGKDWKTKENSEHPSWLAASRPEKSATILPFAGKKITFDD